MSLCDEVQVRYRREDGVFEDVELARLEAEDVLSGWPVREFRVYKGRRHYSGWYASSTMGRHVVYESRLELARLMLADQDPSVTRIAAQPMQLRGRDGRRVRTHIPDFLLEHQDGSLTLVDVKAPDRMAEPRTVAQFAWTATVCAAGPI